MRDWDIRFLALPGTAPAVLSTSEDARGIAIEIPAGDALRDHQVHERAWVTVIAGEVEMTTAEGDRVLAAATIGVGFALAAAVFHRGPEHRRRRKPGSSARADDRCGQVQRASGSTSSDPWWAARWPRRSTTSSRLPAARVGSGRGFSADPLRLGVRRLTRADAAGPAQRRSASSTNRRSPSASMGSWPTPNITCWSWTAPSTRSPRSARTLLNGWPTHAPGTGSSSYGCRA